ncbi:MAG: hypothetical protein IT548_01180 [Alphaproteobacteria bacterium]|nr:hypothetical protein [Alphaproteobacteria bacterium]
MIEDIAPLTLGDEGLNHQIADTFAAVRESDRGWTEKIWAAIARKDGGLGIDFGLGKYANRNVMDGFGGVSRNREQWTVRASRRLAPQFDDTVVLPLRYEVIRPFEQVRFVLEKNAIQPIAYDIVFDAELPVFWEKRNRHRANGRLVHDVIRYHQPGRVTGWLELEGQRIALGDDWFAFRDHSWGMRGDAIGMVPTDLQPGAGVATNRRLLWGPWLFTRSDGTKYEIQSFFNSAGDWEYYSAYLNEGGGNQLEGRQTPIRKMTPNVRLDPKTRAFLGGTFELEFENGETRTIEVEGVGESGFHLRTAQYGGWKGGRHGSWRGENNVEGEYIPDCVAILKELGPLRDKPLRVRDGDAVGWGIQESIYTGDFPELGLGPDSDSSADL